MLNHHRMTSHSPELKPLPKNMLNRSSADMSPKLVTTREQTKTQLLSNKLNLQILLCSRRPGDDDAVGGWQHHPRYQIDHIVSFWLDRSAQKMH